VVSLSTDPCASLTSSFISGKFLAGTRVGYSMKNCNFSNIAVFGMGTGFTVPINCKLDGYFYSCGTAFLELTKCTVTGSIGYDVNNVAKANTTNYGFYNSPGSCNDALFLNTKLDSLKLASQNAVNAAGRVRYEHYLQVNGAHYVADVFGDIVKTPADGTGDNPTQRNGGGADILEAVPQSNCAAVSYLELLTIRLWATAGVSRTYRFYVQTDFAALLATALKLYGEYLDQVSGGHLATVSSTQDITTRATPSDWSQYVEVTINPARDGYVNLYLRLMGYEAGKKVWIDPVPAGVTLTPRWSYGEVVLEPIRGGNASSTNLGLVPLGIKQVAI
jgi:hypothetical protein